MTDCILRKATRDDDVTAIARLIYLTDPYIYPALSPDCGKDFCELCAACLDDCENFYYRDNLYLALSDGKIVSLIAAVENGKSYRFVPPTYRKAVTEAVLSGYYGPLAEETKALTGRTVVNICTDPDERGKGFGKALLSYYLEEKKSEAVYLDVLADNAPAIGLYQSLGFQILKAYEGFGTDGPVACYHMLRR